MPCVPTADREISYVLLARVGTNPKEGFQWPSRGNKSWL
jgi:hypothetical protein